MSNLNTSIEWTDATWSPVTGCDQVSPGCDHCYAMTLAARLKKMGNPRYQNDGTRKTSGPGFGVTLHPDKLDEPLHWRKPRVVFVNSMSDLFHPDVPDQFIAEVFATMMFAPQHTFQVLTKRPRRMRDLLNRDGFRVVVNSYAEDIATVRSTPVLGYEWDALSILPLSNVWLGVSVENQEWADRRIPLLLETPAAVRFLSCEPLLEPISLSAHLTFDHWPYPASPQVQKGIHWVIVGGESGAGARPMDLEWARSLRDQCQAAGIPYFLKQLGGVRDKRGHDDALLDGRLWREMPHVP